MTVDTATFASSNLSSAEWDSETGDANVTFNRGNRYVVHDVSESEWLSLKSAFSPGRFYNENFKNEKAIEPL